MQLDTLFRKPKNELEKGGRRQRPQLESEKDEMSEKCPKCSLVTPVSVLSENFHVCACGYNFRISARQRLSYLADPGTFTELFDTLESRDLLGFPGYADKLASLKLSSNEREAVLCGTAEVGGYFSALFAMDPGFMMGSMGTVVGEKITLLFEYATAHSLPVIGCAVSGGARMQEGLLSLMQMAKTSGAVRRHSDAGNLYITLLTDPTTGGVTASFAMLGDILIAEPGATIGFAGARVVEQTVRKKLPPNFQRAELLLEHGFIDLIVPRSNQKKTITEILRMHR